MSTIKEKGPNRPQRPASMPSECEDHIDTELTPTHTRRQSILANCSSVKNGNATQTYDSGNYSSSSNNSESGIGVGDYESDCSVFQKQEQSLFLALQDVRKLRSELERLSKSEQWYKLELRQQKQSRLESLEKFYGQERQYMRENQRLQRECVRLYAKCGEMEQSLQLQRAKAVEELRSTKRNQETAEVCATCENHFELDQHQTLLKDQQQLIAVLRKQKYALLADLKQLSEEKDDKLHALQSTHANLEVENTRLTKKCKSLLKERQALQASLELNATHMALEDDEKLKLQALITNLSAQLDNQEHLLLQKEHEILSLQVEFKANLKNETNVDEVHRLSLIYHAEMNEKTAQIVTLQNLLLQMQEELSTLGELNSQIEEQARQIENLNFSLKTQDIELDELKHNDTEKTKQISALQLSEQQLYTDNAASVQQLNAKQTLLQKLQQDLIVLNERYADMCSICERTKFELELLKIDKSKLQHKAKSDEKEIAQLKEKLKEYLSDVAILSRKITELEQALQKLVNEKKNSLTALDKSANQMIGKCTKLKRADDMLVENVEALEELSVIKSKPLSQKPSNELRIEIEEKLVVNDDSTSVANEYLKKEVVGEPALSYKLKDQLQVALQECKESTAKLGYQHAETLSLRRKLLENDAKLYKLQRDYKNLSENASKTEISVAAFESLKTENILLKEKLKNVENQIAEKNSDELHILRVRIQELEKHIKISDIEAEAKRTQRIALLKNLLEHQKNKLRHINDTQGDWEELLVLLNSTQSLQEKTHRELELKSTELEELNGLFVAQNESLRKLQESSFLVEFQKQSETDKFQQQLNVIQDHFSDNPQENSESVKFLSELATKMKSLKLSEELGADNTKEYGKIMELNIVKLLEGGKGMTAKQINENIGERAANIVQIATDSNEQLKAICDHRNKRYNCANHTFLDNVNVLKRPLKAAILQGRKVQTDTQDDRMIKQSLLNLRFKYAQSQRKVKALEHTLAVERQHKAASDFGKSTQKTPPTVHEAPNLIDDYKKLIQQSALATNRLQTSTILEIIERSNQCVPNLNKLDAVLLGLRSDLWQFLAKQQYEPATTPKVPTLMDELLAAREHF